MKIAFETYLWPLSQLLAKRSITFIPGFIAKKLCPELVIVPLNFAKYTEVSKVVREVFKEYDPSFCSMSLDEAFLVNIICLRFLKMVNSLTCFIFNWFTIQIELLVYQYN